MHSPSEAPKAHTQGRSPPSQLRLPTLRAALPLPPPLPQRLPAISLGGSGCSPGAAPRGGGRRHFALRSPPPFTGEAGARAATASSRPGSGAERGGPGAGTASPRLSQPSAAVVVVAVVVRGSFVPPAPSPGAGHGAARACVRRRGRGGDGAP